MSLAVKLGLGAIGIAGAGTTAVILTKSLSEPSSTTLSKCTEENCKYTNQFGGVEDNRKFLVADIESNKEWWDWVYENRLKPSKDSSETHEDFKKATSGYSGESTSLNKICDAIYKKNKTDADKDKLKESSAKFCSRDPGAKLESPKS